MIAFAPQNIILYAHYKILIICYLQWSPVLYSCIFCSVVALHALLFFDDDLAFVDDAAAAALRFFLSPPAAAADPPAFTAFSKAGGYFATKSATLNLR
jgi:hypothetical protein